MKNGHISGSMGTLFSSTCKIGRSNMHLHFCLKAKWLRYIDFDYLSPFPLGDALGNTKTCTRNFK